MLFGKIFTAFALAATAIAPVACAPTADTDVSVVKKRTTLGDAARTCYGGVQQRCGNINNCISEYGGAQGGIDTNSPAVAILQVEVQGVVTAMGDFVTVLQATAITSDDVEDVVPTFILIVNILVEIFGTMYGACTAEALALLVNIVIQISAQINLIATLLLGTISALIGGLLSLTGELLTVLLGFRLDINACISAFTSACGPYQS